MRERPLLIYALRVSIVLLVIALPSLGRSEAPADKPLLDRDAVIAAAKDVTVESYPNADDVVLDDYTAVRYNADGTSVELSDSYQKILTEKGRRSSQTIRVRFTIPYDKVALLALEVIKPDGRIVPVDIETQSRVMIDAGQMNQNIYNPNDKVLQVGVPGLEVGDILRTFSRSEQVKTIVPNTWSDLQLFEYTSPIRHAVYEVLAPHDLPLRSIVLKDPIPGTVQATTKEIDDGIRYRWEVTEVPRMFTEPNMPAMHQVVQRLVVSTAAEWEEISRWYWQVSEPHLNAVTPEMREKVDEITKGLDTSGQKAEAVFRWVSQQIRYLGITVETEAPGFEPHDVRATFEQRHGVCRDKAALLVSMLRLAGLDAYPVLIYVGPKKDVEVPQSSFNHAIVAVEYDDDTVQLMDPTDESSKDMFPAYLSNRSYLLAKPKGATLRTSPIVPASQNMMHVKTAARLDASGGIAGESVLTFRGINDSSYRGYFARLGPEERQLYFEAALKRMLPGAELLAFELAPTDMLDTSQELVARLRFRADDILVRNSGTAMFEIPTIGGEIGLASLVLGKVGLAERKYPLVTEVACGIDEELELEVDPALGAPAALPMYGSIDNEGVSWKADLAYERGLLKVHGVFAVKVVEFSPEQYRQLKRDLRTIEFESRKMPILKKADGENADADVRLLDRRVTINVQDAHTWSEEHYVKKKVLSYKGKKEHAEAKFSFNSAWENVRVLEARVINGRQVQDVGAAEMNLMDDPWVASAPRYPAGKTLVVSFPGVEEGSIIEYRVMIEKRQRPFFSTLQIFRDFNPLELKQLRIVAPEDLPLRVLRDENGIMVADASGPVPLFSERETRNEGRVERDWIVRAQSALKREEQSPPLYGMTPMLEVTSGNWRQYAKELQKVLAAAAANQPNAKAAAERLVDGVQGTRERVRAVRDFVAVSIRAAGPNLEQMPFSAVSAADQTLAEGYGNITDRAVLLYAMLDALQLHPEFVAVSSAANEAHLREFREQYPDLDTFDRVLVRVAVDDGMVLLNDTDQYARLGTTSLEGRLALMLSGGGTEALSLDRDLQDAVEHNYHLSLKADGSATLRMLRKDYGMRFGGAHKQFEEMSPEERRRYYEELVSAVSQSAQAVGLLTTDFAAYPGIVSYTVAVDRFAVRDGGYLYFELPQTLEGLLGLGGDARVNPLWRGATTRMRINQIIELPPEFAHPVLLPKGGEWLLPDGGGRVAVKVATEPLEGQDGAVSRVTITYDVDLEPAVIGSSNYGDLLRINRELSHEAAKMVLLAGASAGK